MEKSSMKNVVGSCGYSTATAPYRTGAVLLPLILILNNHNAFYTALEIKSICKIKKQLRTTKQQKDTSKSARRRMQEWMQRPENTRRVSGRPPQQPDLIEIT